MIAALAGAFGLGVVSGLRAFTGHLTLVLVGMLGWPLPSLPVFTTWTSTRFVIVLLGLGEYIGDKLPGAPDRTALPGLIARIVLGGACGYYVAAIWGGAWWLFTLVGAAGGVAGAYGGLYARKALTERFPDRKFLIAAAEDLFALLLGSIIWIWLSPGR